MSKADQLFTIVLWLSLAIHVTVLIVGLTTNKLPFLAAWMNLIVGLSVLCYWIQKHVRIEYHVFEMREWVVLGFEFFVAGTSLYLIANKQWHGAIRVLTYSFFGLHLVALILVAVFALTFKMNRLF